MLGAAAGIAAFLWTVAWQSNRAITHGVELGFAVRLENSHVIADMTVENKEDTRKKLDYAALVFTPSEEPFVSAARELASCAHASNFDASTPAMALITLPRPDGKLQCGNDLIEPVPFLYAEQQDIGNERIGCQMSVEVSELAPEQAI
jgi:hypothetical protein